MLNEDTKRKLRLMNLGEFIEGIEHQEADPQMMDLPFEERFQILTDSVYQKKYNTKVQKLIKGAKFRLPKADMHDLYYDKGRPINRTLINELSTCKFVEDHQSVIIQGYSSSGKTFLSCALGKEACRHQYRTRYIRMSDLLTEYDDLSLEHGGKNKILKKYSAFNVLVLDEWLTKDISKEELEFLFELTERRFDCTSTIFCTLHHKEEWVKRLGKGTMAESIVERYNHNVINIETGEMNMRAIFAAHT